LAIWGLIGYTIFALGFLFELFGKLWSMYFLGLGGLWELFFGVRLIGKKIMNICFFYIIKINNMNYVEKLNIYKIHHYSGIIVSTFVAVHLFNHLISVYGADQHISCMTRLRVIYRNPFVETILLVAVGTQIFSGITLFKRLKKSNSLGFQKLQIWSGLYLALFFLIHVGAVAAGRYVLHLDTNFYFGVSGLNTFPFNLFFIPYYILAINAFFCHIAALHHKKMKHTILNLSPEIQSKSIVLLGVILSIIILYGLTNQFNGVTIPAEYNVLIGK
jgi:hypothetical protein